MREELGKEIINEKLFLIMENFFKTETGKPFHELGFYYKAEVLGFDKQEDFEIKENDKGVEKRLSYKWIAFEDIDDVDLRPAILKDFIKNREFDEVKHIINTDQLERR